MTYILHLDTSAQLCTVFISQDAAIISSRTLDDSKEQSSRINGMIAEVCSDASIGMSDLSAVSVCNGPGSYTGLRVGLSTAKGICFALHIPLLLHNKLTLIAADYSQFSNRAIAVKAREGEVFAAFYQDHILMKAPAHYFTESFISELSKIENIQVIGNDADIFQENLFPLHLIPESGNFNLENWSKIALNAYKNKEFSDLAYAEPFYMKAAFTTKPKK